MSDRQTVLLVLNYLTIKFNTRLNYFKQKCLLGETLIIKFKKNLP